jgi:hypothetical protein
MHLVYQFLDPRPPGLSRPTSGWFALESLGRHNGAFIGRRHYVPEKCRQWIAFERHLGLQLDPSQHYVAEDGPRFGPKGSVRNVRQDAQPVFHGSGVAREGCKCQPVIRPTG